MVWRSLASLGASAMVLVVEPAWAQAPASEVEERYALSWVRGEGAEGCPTRSELAGEVTKRLGRSPFDEAAERTIEIQVERDEQGYKSRTLVRDAQGSVLGRRELVSEEPSCAPLFSATSLAVALLIDPEAALRGDSPPQGVARFESSAPPEPKPAEAETRTAEPTAPSITPAPSPAPPVDRSVEKSSRTGGSAATEAVIAFGLVPDVSPGAGLYVERRGERWGIAANALYVSSATASAAGAVFDVGLTAFGLSGTLEVLSADSARLALDVGPLVGALNASVRSPTPTDPGDFLFAAVSGGARMELQIEPVVLSLRGAALVSLVRRGLFVEGSRDPVWREPPVAGLLAAGAGLSFL